MNDFIKEGVKVGDRLYSITRGWGKVTEVNSQNDYCIYVRYELDDYVDSFTKYGKVSESHQNPILFWDEPKFEIPQKPKREVEIVEEVFLNYYPNRGSANARMCLYNTSDEAKRNAFETCDHVAIPAKITFTILE